MTYKPKTPQVGLGLFYQNNRKQIRTQIDTRNTGYSGNELDRVGRRNAKGFWRFELEKAMECSELRSYYRSVEEKNVERGTDVGRLTCEVPKGSSLPSHSKT